MSRIDVGFWRSSAAISTVTLGAATGNLATSSRATLYAFG
jgi:hypothetical protein